MNDEEDARFRVSDVVDFCRRNDTRGLCFGGWPDDILEIYFGFHQKNGSLCLVEEDGVLVGMGVGYQCNEEHMDRHWLPFNPEGDSFYVSDLICSKGRFMATCVDELKERVPNWKELKLFYFRHGERRRMKPEVLERLLCSYQDQ